ncbi:MAG: XisH family protein [Saprospiraceae bacterium]|jgi:hypothetical protein|nr:XisH family protein [Saprospiraceae bacterium]
MARDLVHHIVREALEKDGWKITHDPYPIRVGGFDMEIDLGAEELVAAEKGGQKIAVEIKSFAGYSKVYDFHLAVGQFFDYRRALREKEPERNLFVGILDDTYEEVFKLPFVQMVMEELNMKLVVVNGQTKTVVLWKK